MESHATIVVNCLMLAMKSPQFRTLLANDTQNEYPEIKRYELDDQQPKGTSSSIRYEFINII